MHSADARESFRSLLLLHRGRTGLTQRDLAARAGVSVRSVQDWEAGVTLPTAQRLQALIRALLEAGGLAPGGEMSEAHELWAAVEREGRMHASFDGEWLTALLARRQSSQSPPASDGPQSAWAAEARTGAAERAHDWGDAPDTSGFVGRAEELALLRQWLLEDRCRLVAVLGMGGIGKTTLAAKFAQDVAPSFERLYWRSLRNAPPIGEWLAGAIGVLSDHHIVPPTSESERVPALLQVLRARRCLLVLDNSETLFEPGQREGHYRAGMEGYGRLLQAIGDASHQSCLMFTSREAPPELAVLGGAVRTLEVHGLGIAEAQRLLADKQLIADSEAWLSLVNRYGGNGLALKIVGETIRQVYGGELGAFLGDASATYGVVFGGIRRLLDAQAERLSPLERDVLARLAVEREPISVAELSAEMAPGAGRPTVIEAIENLRRRSLVERGERGATFTLQSMVLEYVTDRLVESVADEIEAGAPVVLVEQPLIKAQAKDYARQTQERLLGAPILQRLIAQHDEADAEQRLIALLDGWRGRPAAEQGYGPGNVVNLLRVLRGHLRGIDLSRLAIRQAYLAQVAAQDASLVDAHLVESTLAEAFHFPVSVALSGDGVLLAAGTSTGEVWLWRGVDRTPILAVQGHAGAVNGVALSADGHLLASGGGDATVQLWETGTGRLLASLRGHSVGVGGVALSADGRLLALGGSNGIVQLCETGTGRLLGSLQGHTGGIRGVALSADGRLLASGGTEGTVRLWDTRTGRPVSTVQAHTGGVWSVALSADGDLLASGGTDGMTRLWETATCRPLAALQGHTGEVRGVALSADGHLLASATSDGTTRLWDTGSSRPVATLQGHTGTVWGVVLSADGHLLASASGDGSVRLWETGSGSPLATLQGDTGGMWGVALSAEGDLLASVGEDGMVRLWDAGTGRAHATLQGHSGGVRGVALSPDGQQLVSGSEDGTVRRWDARSGRAAETLQGHTGGVWGVALSSDGRLLVSGSEDGSVRLWETSTGRPLAILRGHTGGVRCVALSGEAGLLASGSADGTVRLWETAGGRPVATLRGHTGVVWSVAFSGEGRLLASGSGDHTVRLWETALTSGTRGEADAEPTLSARGFPAAPPSAARPLATLSGHDSAVWSVALSTDGRLLASSGADATVRLWETGTGRSLAILQGHVGGVRSVVLSADNQQVVSGSLDGTVKLWDTRSGACLRTLRPERRYERMDITGLTGITEARRAALLALGAVDQHAPIAQPTARLPLVPVG